MQGVEVFVDLNYQKLFVAEPGCSVCHGPQLARGCPKIRLVTSCGEYSNVEAKRRMMSQGDEIKRCRGCTPGLSGLCEEGGS